MADFNIPDAVGPETAGQERDRVRPHIPANLLELWRAAVDAAQEPPDQASSGWPEMVATFLQLTPNRLMMCLATMGQIHLQKLGGSMIKVESSSCVMIYGTDAARPFLRRAYGEARADAVLSSHELRSNPTLAKYVQALTTLVAVAGQCAHQLADAAMVQEVPTAQGSCWATNAVELGRAADVVAKLLEAKPQ